MNVLKVLEDARSFVEKGWCPDALSRHDRYRVVGPLGDYVKKYDKDGKEIDPPVFFPATSWSMTGAILAAEGSQSHFKTEAYQYLTKAAKAHGFNYNADFEGVKKRTKEEVLDLMDDAIQIYKEECNTPWGPQNSEEWAHNLVEDVNKRYPKIMEALGPE